MNILFVGGSGFIGRAAVRAFAPRAASLTVVTRQAGFQTTLDALVDAAAAEAVTRGQAPTPRPRTGVVVCDLIENGPNAAFVEAVRRADIVFYSLQFPGHPVQRPSEGLTYARYDAGGFRLVLDVLVGTEDLRTAGEGVRPPPRRVLYVSGAGAGQGREEPWFRAKDDAEASGRDWAERTGGSFLSLRPSVVFGADDVSLNKVFRAAKLTRVCPLFGRGDTPLSPLWVNDLARAFALFGPFDATHARFPLEGAFDLPGPEDMTFREALATMFEAAHLAVRPVFVPVPVGLAKAGASLLAWLPKAPLTPEAIDFLTTGPALSLPPPGSPERALLEPFRAGCATLRSVFASTAGRD